VGVLVQKETRTQRWAAGGCSNPMYLQINLKYHMGCWPRTVVLEQNCLRQQMYSAALLIALLAFAVQHTDVLQLWPLNTQVVAGGCYCWWMVAGGCYCWSAAAALKVHVPTMCRPVRNTQCESCRVHHPNPKHAIDSLAACHTWS
jgi:hypothetical protein